MHTYFTVQVTLRGISSVVVFRHTFVHSLPPTALNLDSSVTILSHNVGSLICAFSYFSANSKRFFLCIVVQSDRKHQSLGLFLLSGSIKLHFDLDFLLQNESFSSFVENRARKSGFNHFAIYSKIIILFTTVCSVLFLRHNKSPIRIGFGTSLSF